MIIDGKKEAQLLRDEIKKEIELLKSKNNKVPGLTVILIGDFVPSQIYVKNKERAAPSALLYIQSLPAGLLVKFQ